jgi:tRNA (guanine37-N1)-methyltransferase
VIGAKVKKEDCEKALKELHKRELVDSGFSLKKEGDFIIIPLKEKTDGFSLVEASFDKRDTKPASFKETLSSRLEEGQLSDVPLSYDVVGGVAVLSLPENLMDKKEIVKDAFLEFLPKIKTILLEKGPTDGTFRVPEYEILFGKDTETIHRENGISMKLNLTTCYFSPRLSHERERIAAKVKDGEEVMVFFSGIGPYPLVMEKLSNPAHIDSIEINPDAVRYQRENIKLNKIEGKIEVFLGDVKKIAPKIKKKYDRIVMPAPLNAGDFLDEAKMLLKKGGTIHYYFFSGEEEMFKTQKKRLEQEGFKVLEESKCGQIGVRQWRLCMDAKLL